MIYATIFAALFVVTMALTGTHHWGTALWWQGMAAGVTLGLVWHANRAAAKFLGLVGVSLLVAAALGFGTGLPSESQAFFNGMSLAMPIGFGLSAWWRWERFRPRLVMIAKAEHVQWLLRVLGER